MSRAIDIGIGAGENFKIGASNLEFHHPEREALAALDPLWAELFPAEQARIIQLLIERVDIGTNGLKLRFRDQGLAQMVAEVGIMNGKGQKAA